MLVYTLILLSSLIYVPGISGQLQVENPRKPVWSRRLDICDFSHSGQRIRSEGIAIINPREAVAYCVMTAPSPHPGLSSRTGKPTFYPYRMLALFLDANDGRVLQKASWPTLVNTQTDIFPVSDSHLLLVAGNRVQLIDRSTLSILEQLQLPFPGSGCEPWRVTASPDGSSFGVSQVCDAGANYESEISVYRTADFAQVGSWRSEGRNFYNVDDSNVSRWSSNPGFDHDIFVRNSEGVETDLRAVGFTVAENIFINRGELLCCRNEPWLRILTIDGHEVAFYNVDPKHSPDNPKNLADQIFVSRTGQRIAALIFHVPWTGPVHWECDVFNRKLQRLLKIQIPAYRRDLTAALSPDGKYIFILRDDQIEAYVVPDS